MRKIVFKRFFIQLVIVIAIVIPLVIIANTLFGIRTIKYKAEGIAKNKFLVVGEYSDTKLFEVNKSILTSYSGKKLLETDGQIMNMYFAKDKSLVLSATPDNTINKVYVADSTDMSIKPIDFPFKNINGKMINETEMIKNIFCLSNQINGFNLSCFKIDPITYLISQIDTSEVNSIISAYKSNLYELFNTEDKSDGKVLHLQIKYSGTPGVSEYNDKVLELFVNDTTSKVGFVDANHKVNNSNDSGNPFIQGVSADKMYGISPALFSTTVQYLDNSELLGWDSNLNGYRQGKFDTANLSSPLIGMQQVTGWKYGVSTVYMEWFSTFRFTKNLQVGLLGQDYLFLKANSSLYFIDVNSKEVFKMNKDYKIDDNKYYYLNAF
ncbi:MAG: hypothetical protein WCO33_03465 [bacterium]